MEWLLNNPIANMYGPYFLLLYGVVNVLTLSICWLVVRNRSSFLPSIDSSSGVRGSAKAAQFTLQVKMGGAFVIASCPIS